MSNVNRGLWYALGAYLLWGFSPIYWKFLTAIPASEILANRMVWSLLFLLLILTYRQQWAWLNQIRQNPSRLVPVVLAAMLLTVNWFTYIWGVNSGNVIETSLGYFINPLVSVLFGMLFFGESLRRGQVVAVITATLGVVYLTINYGELPVIALTLAISFGFYGLLKKKSKLAAVEGLSLEMACLLVPAVAYLGYLANNEQGALGEASLPIHLFLFGTGVITAMPLLLFAAGAKRIQLATIGILQYVAPTIQFLLGVFLFQESFDSTRLVGFCLIWFALAMYTSESLLYQRRLATAS